jgi:hypothetical protein
MPVIYRADAGRVAYAENDILMAATYSNILPKNHFYPDNYQEIIKNK